MSDREWPPLLATVCNTLPGAVPFSLWFTERGREYLVDLSDCLGQPGDSGLTGLAVCGNRIYLAVQSSGASRVLILDRRLVPVGTIASPRFKDLHSLHAAGDSLIAVSTGLGSALRVDLRTHEISDVLQLGPGLHLNSVCENATGLLACCHTMSALAQSARMGGVFNVTTGSVVVDGLSHPHSILATETEFLVLDSGNERLVAVPQIPGSGEMRQVTLRGFLRGAVLADRSLFVAGCPGRVVSRKSDAATASRGFWAAMGEQNLIHAVDLETMEVRSTVSPLIAGYEIYELASLAGLDGFEPAAERLIVPGANAIARAFYEAAKRAGREKQILARKLTDLTPPSPAVAS